MEKKIYLKDESFDPIYNEVSKGFYTKTRVLPSVLFITGLLVFTTQVILPVLVFKTNSESVLLMDNATILGRTAGFYDFEFNELQLADADEKNEENVLGTKTNVPEVFYLSIPKLKIEDAVVESNAKTLNPNDSLGHYPGTALPGEKGNSFIFGHSVLPWFFNSNNYKTIFSTLGRLEPGDEYSIKYNNNEFNYVVESIEELAPEDVKPLADIKPAYLNKSTVVLMTCSPPGTKLKRLLINSVLID